MPSPEILKDLLEDDCKHCGWSIHSRNPSGTCDHLYWPENLSDEAKRANGYVPMRVTVWVLKEAAGVDSTGYGGQQEVSVLKEALERILALAHWTENGDANYSRIEHIARTALSAQGEKTDGN